MDKYITRGIQENVPLLIQLQLWNMVEERNRQQNKDYFHIFTFDYQNNQLKITHEQEQPHYSHTVSLAHKEPMQISKVYVIQEDDVDLSYRIMLLPNEY